MQISYTDSRQWKYHFTINEGDLYVEVSVWDNFGNHIHREYVNIQENGSLRWLHFHTRDKNPLVSAEARAFCDKMIKSFLKLKAFW